MPDADTEARRIAEGLSRPQAARLSAWVRWLDAAYYRDHVRARKPGDWVVVRRLETLGLVEQCEPDNPWNSNVVPTPLGRRVAEYLRGRNA